MPHGDFSDYVAFFSLALGMGSIFRPEEVYTFQVEPYVKPLLNAAPSQETTAVIQFSGGLLMFVGFVCYVNRWNTLNGKAGALGLWIAAATSVLISYKIDGDFSVDLIRVWHVIAAMFTAGGAHLAFNANPMWTSKSLAVREKERAAKKKN